jgi:hypothetical protein
LGLRRNAFGVGRTRDFAPRNPNGVAAQSPRLLYSATLGNGSDHPRNPNGVAAGLHVESARTPIAIRDNRSIGYTGRLGPNPGEVAELAAVFPRVAEYSNPGLEDVSPFGENVQTLGIKVLVEVEVMTTIEDDSNGKE